MARHRKHLTLATGLLLWLHGCGGGSSGTGADPQHPPQDLAYSDEDALVAAGVEIDPLLPTVAGDVVAFTIAPALPAGLVLDPVTGIIAGTPAQPAPRRAYEIAARNEDGVARATVRIEIAAPSRLALVASMLDGSLAALAVDGAAQGFVRSALCLESEGGAGVDALAVRPDGRFAYLASDAIDAATVIALAPDGSGQQVGAADLEAGPHALAIDPTGGFLLVASRSAGTVAVFAIDAEDGALSAIDSVATGAQPSDLAFAADGRTVFVTHAGRDFDGLGSTLAAFAFDPASGILVAQGTPLQLNGGRPTALCVDPHDPYLYLTLGQFGDVLSVQVTEDGAFQPVPPLRPAGDAPKDIAIDARGRYAYVASSGTDLIHAFRIASATHKLSGAGSFDIGMDPVALASDPLGERLYAVARGTGVLVTLAIEDDGSLATLGTLALRTGPAALALVRGAAPLAWSPRWVHVLSSGSSDVESFAIDATDGALTSTGIAPSGEHPVAFALDPRQRFLLVLSDGARTLEPFAIDPASGALEPPGPARAIAGVPASVVIEPSGRFAYVAAHDVVVPGDGWILTFALAAGSGDLTPVDARPAGLGSIVVSVDPTGRFAYVANTGDSTPGSASIATFRLDPGTGRPQAAGQPVAAPGVSGISFHPDGGSAYAILRGSDALARYTIDGESGALLPVPPVAGGGLEPAALAIEPRGRFAYVSLTALEGDGEIDLLSVAQDGSLGPAIQQVVDGRDPVALALEPSGRFLYAANLGSGDVSVLAIGADGFLTVGAPALAGDAPVAIVASGMAQ